MPKSKKAESGGQVPHDSPDGNLTDKEELFIHEYLIDFNATQAATRAGYSEKSARTIGPRTLSKDVIRQRIEQVCAERKKQLALSQERVIRELEHVAYARMNNYVRVKNGRVFLMETEELDVGMDAAIQSYSETTTQHGGSTSIKLHDKLKAIEMLGAYLKLFKEDDDSEDKSTELDRLRKLVTDGISETLSGLKGKGRVE